MRDAEVRTAATSAEGSRCSPEPAPLGGFMRRGASPPVPPRGSRKASRGEHWNPCNSRGVGNRSSAAGRLQRRAPDPSPRAGPGAGSAASVSALGALPHHSGRTGAPYTLPTAQPAPAQQRPTAPAMTPGLLVSRGAHPEASLGACHQAQGSGAPGGQRAGRPPHSAASEEGHFRGGDQAPAPSGWRQADPGLMHWKLHLTTQSPRSERAGRLPTDQVGEEAGPAATRPSPTEEAAAAPAQVWRAAARSTTLPAGRRSACRSPERGPRGRSFWSSLVPRLGRSRLQRPERRRGGATTRHRSHRHSGARRPPLSPAQRAGSRRTHTTARASGGLGPT